MPAHQKAYRVVQASQPKAMAQEVSGELKRYLPYEADWSRAGRMKGMCGWAVAARR